MIFLYQLARARPHNVFTFLVLWSSVDKCEVPRSVLFFRARCKRTKTSFRAHLIILARAAPDVSDFTDMVVEGPRNAALSYRPGLLRHSGSPNNALAFHLPVALANLASLPWLQF